MGFMNEQTTKPTNTSRDVTDFDTAYVISLEKTIQSYAWKRYLKFLGCPRKLFNKRDKHYFDFQWDVLDFQHSTKMTMIEADDILLEPIDFCSPSNFQRQRSKCDYKNENCCRYSYMNMDIGFPDILNASCFENETLTSQRYGFSTQRETTTKVTVEFQENYTLGERTNIEITIPGKYLGGSERHKCLHINGIHGQVFEEAISWDVATEVTVDSGHRAKVFLSVQEQETLLHFEVETRVFLSKAWLPVVIRRKSDHKAVYTCLITNLRDVFSEHHGPNVDVMKTTDKQNHVNFQVMMASRGLCKITGFVDPQVIVSSEKIRG